MEIDRRIQEKRSELREAFVAHKKACEATMKMRKHLSELLLAVGLESSTPNPESLEWAKAQLQRLDSEERIAANRFGLVSEELVQLHREKFGAWHITWKRTYRP